MCLSLFESTIGPVRRISRRASHYSGPPDYDHRIVLETGYIMLVLARRRHGANAQGKPNSITGLPSTTLCRTLPMAVNLNRIEYRRYPQYYMFNRIDGTYEATCFLSTSSLTHESNFMRLARLKRVRFSWGICPAKATKDTG